MSSNLTSYLNCPEQQLFKEEEEEDSKVARAVDRVGISQRPSVRHF